MTETEIDYKKIGGNIRYIRNLKGLSQIQLAKQLKISQTHMSNIENGNVGISLATAVKITRSLGCTVDEILEGKQAETQKAERGDDLLSGCTVEDLLAALKLVSLKNRLDR